MDANAIFSGNAVLKYFVFYFLVNRVIVNLIKEVRERDLNLGL